MKSIFLIFCLSHAIYAELSDSYINMQFAQQGYASDCIYFNVKQLTSKINAEIYSDSSLSLIDVELLDPNQKVLVKSEGVSRQEIFYPYTDGAMLNEIGHYSICFKNIQRTPNTIFLTLEVSEKNDENIDVASNMHRIKQNINKQLESQMTLKNFEEITLRIDQKLTTIRRYQSKRRNTEHIQRDNMEYLYTKVNVWGIVHTIVVITSSISQVMFIRAMLQASNSSDRYHRY